jgi:hypothetical protein
LHQLGTADIRERLITASHRAGLRSEVAWVDRTLALVAGNVSPDQAHDPANKDQALKDRYTRLRAAER